MSGSQITLKDFVRPVPTCQQEETVETVLALVRSNQQTTIAVMVDRLHKPIGVLEYRRLLPVIAEHWLNCFTPRVGLDKFGSAAALAKRDSSEIFTQNLDLNSLKEPIVSLSSNMGVPEFLSCLKERGKKNTSSQHYILVDVRGKLLGLLDVPQLLETLFSNRQNTETTVLQNQPNNHWFFELLEQTPLPLMLQASEGQTLYQNHCWRERVNHQKETNQPENTEISLPQRQQRLLSNGNWSAEPETHPYCLKGNYRLTSTFASLWQPTITAQSLEILSSLTSELSSDRSRLERENLNSISESVTSLTAPTTTNAQNIWQYTKLPIDCTNYQCLPTNCSQKCWLVLATPTCQTRKSSPQAATKDTEERNLNRWRDEFFASIGHELKSPLTAIVSLSSLLKEQKLGTLNQRQLRYSELIYRSGRQLMNIVNDLLDWSRLTGGKLKLNLEPIKIRTICEEVYQQVLDRQATVNKTKEISYSNLKFKLDIEPGLETIVADKLRLCQILNHFLDNIFKFISSDGEVGISVTLWTKWIAIIVWNTGRSMSDLSHPLGLEQFFQSETFGVEHSEELGLVLAQQLAKAHGGDISFISQVGMDSEFTLLLPYRENSCTRNWQSEVQALPTDANSCDPALRMLLSSTVSRQTQMPSTSKTRTVKHSRDGQNNSLILVVETVGHCIVKLANQLKELGYCPLIARTAAEALYKARQFKPSKILLNSSLSLFSGDDLLTLLKSDPLTAHIPVWITTEGKQKQVQKSDCVEGLLNLPIDKEILAQTLSPIKKQSSSQKKSLTILRLYSSADEVRAHQPATTENSSTNFGLNNDLYNLHYRVIEADSLEQAEILARIWQLDAILLDGILTEPLQYLYSLQKYESLAALPIVTLDAKTTEAANQVKGLSVYPCLVPADERSLVDLAQVIQIATVINRF